ncbi:hypothetical protein AYO45_05000 [Gammaproteobacteria bacterium SCGC AG-212-F23]|nr:hypothetical protein AYO45_05000 [Gammaproteobacteria bacterium SCGC AG-212-F23]
MSQTIRNLLNELAFEFSIDELTPNNLVKKDVLHGIGENNRDIADYFGKVLDAQLSNTAYRQLQEKVQLFRQNFLNKSATFIEAYIKLIQEINHLAIPLPEKIKAGLGRSSIRTVRLHIKPEKLIFSLADKANLDAYIHFNNEVQKLQQEYPCLYALLTQPNVRKQWLRLGVVAAVRALLLNYHQGQSLRPLRDVFGVETDSAFLMNAIAEAQSNAVENIDPMFLREPRNSPASSATHEMHFLRALKYLTTGEIEAFYAGLVSCFAGLDEKATKELFQKMLQHPTLKKAVAIHQISLAVVVKRLAEKNDIVKLQWAHLKVELADKINLNEIDHVLVGFVAPDIVIRSNPVEVQAFRWIGLDALQNELDESPGRFTPWLEKAFELVVGGI